MYGSNCSSAANLRSKNINNFMERFDVDKSECSDTFCEDTSLLKIGNNFLLPQIHYISVDNFNKMITDLRFLIIASLKQQANMCNDMNGADTLPAFFPPTRENPNVKGSKPQITHMTFNCVNDIESVQDIVINQISTYIIEYAKFAYNINMNPQLIIKDFTNNLNLMDNVVYPLLYSRKYTIQGINYFTNRMLIDKVVNSLELQNVLITTLQRRGIELLPDSDNYL